MNIPRIALGLIMAGLLVVGCSSTPSSGTQPEEVAVTLQVGAGQTGPAVLQPAGVPSDAHSATIEIYRVGAAGRTLAQTLPIALDAADQVVVLLAGETYDFELSIQAEDATEVAFAGVQAVATPDLVVVLEPVSIIASLRLGEAYYDGTYLIAPIEALTPAGGIAPHTAYTMLVTVTAGTVSASSPLGVEILPDAASTPVTIDVTATGLLATRAEGDVTASLSVTPSDVTPGQGTIQIDLIPPTALIDTTLTTTRVGSYTYITLKATDNRELSVLRLYVNMAQAASTSLSFTTDNYQYRFQPDTARTYTLTLVVEDAAGNIGTDVHRIQVE